MRHLTYAYLAPVILALAASAAQAGRPAEDVKALKSAITCYNDSTAAADHVSKLLSARNGYVPARNWNTASCDLALLVATKNGSAELKHALTIFNASMTTLAADVDTFIVEKKKPLASSDVTGAIEKLSAGIDVYITARRALDKQVDKASIELERADLATLAKKEKKKKEKSTTYYRLAIRVATADLLAAADAKQYVAFSKELTTVYDAVSALATGPDAEHLAEYCGVVLQMHKAASAVTPAWVDADLEALRTAEQAVVKAANAL